MDEGDGPCINNFADAGEDHPLVLYPAACPPPSRQRARTSSRPLTIREVSLYQCSSKHKTLGFCLHQHRSEAPEGGDCERTRPIGGGGGQSVVFTNAVQPSKLNEAPRRLVWGDLASTVLGGRGAHQHDLSRGGFSLWSLVGRKLVGSCYTHGCINPSPDTISLTA